jgi:hypothetical protein
MIRGVAVGDGALLVCSTEVDLSIIEKDGLLPLLTQDITNPAHGMDQPLLAMIFQLEA